MIPSDDIVTQLRLWSDNAKEQDATDVVVGLCEAADEIERLRKLRDLYRRLYLRGLAFHYKAKGVVWRTYVNPQRSDGLFVAGVGSLEHPMQAIPRGVKSVGCQLPHSDAEELVLLLNELSVHLEEEPC